MKNREENVQISIIIALYNAEKFIKRCIDSLVCQTFKDFEVVLVDDASPDSTLSMAETILIENSINYISIKHPVNRGLGAARNSGLDAANGKYILFVDNDDELADSNVLETFHSTIEREKVDMVIGNFDYLYEDGRRERNEIFVNSPERIESDKFKEIYLTYKINTSSWGKLTNRDYILRNRLYFQEGKTVEDHYWLFDICVVGCSCYLLPDSYYLYHRDNSGSITTLWNALDKERVEIDVIEYFLTSCSKRDIDSEDIALYLRFITFRVTNIILGQSSVGCSKSEWRAAYRRIARMYRSSVFWKYKKMCRLPAWLAYIAFVDSAKRYNFKGQGRYRRLMISLNRYNWEGKF